MSAMTIGGEALLTNDGRVKQVKEIRVQVLLDNF